MHDKIQRFSLRKLSVGLVSIMVGACIFSVNGKTVKADVTNDQTIQTQLAKIQEQTATTQTRSPKVQDQTATTRSQSDDVQNKEQQTSSDQNKQKVSTQSGDQVEVKKENSEQNSTVSKQTEQNLNTKSDAEKSSVSSNSTPKIDNQSAEHVEDNFQAQPQNSKKFAKKMLATNLIETTSSPMTNGGFDEATWGKLDVNNWQGSAQDGVYQLTKYTGDLSHIIVPNEADFEQAGKSTNGLQVGITRNTAQSLLSDQIKTIAFSKTNNQKVKAIGTDWSKAFSADNVHLSEFNGSNLDVSSITNMNNMFSGDSISDLTSLANWDTSNVTNMSFMFYGNSISNLAPLDKWNISNVTNISGMFVGNSISDLKTLTNWNTSNVTNMSHMFENNKISNLKPLSGWNTSKVTDMSNLFTGNKISDLAPLSGWKTGKVTSMYFMFYNNSINNLGSLDKWDTSKVTNMSYMFSGNQISDLAPLTNWNISNVTEMLWMFSNNSISNLAPLANWDTSNVTSMYYMFTSNKISDLSPLTKWKTGKVTDMSCMFGNNPNITDLSPIANWNISSASFFGLGNLFSGDAKLDLTNINNTKLMQGILKSSFALAGSTFITNNADLVKVTTGKDFQNLTNTAKSTITFNLPDGTTKTIVQTINYKTIAPVRIDYNSREIVQTYPRKDSDWHLDTSKQNDDVIIDGVICFKPVKMPHINGYKVYLIKDPVNLTAFLVSFVALPQQSQNNQSSNAPSSQKPAQNKPKQPEPIQTTPAKQQGKEVVQIPNHILYALMYDFSDDADNVEPAQNNSDQLENVSDSTQNSDATTSQKANVVRHKKHIVRKHIATRRKKHAKKYHLKRRSKKHTKRAKNAKKYHLKRRSRKHTKRVKNTENRTEIRRKIFKKI